MKPPAKTRARATGRGNTSKPKAPDDPVKAWAEAIVAGEIVAGPHIRNACKRHLKDLIDGPARGLTWDLTAALRAIEFFPDVLRLSEGQFDTLEFHLHPSQQFIVGSLFGWKRRDGTRRFRRAYIEQAKGSGKSPLAAGIGMYLLMADQEKGAQVYAAAANMATANVLFQDAVKMRNQSPALAERLTPSGGNPVWNLADLKTGSFFRPISSEMRKKGSGPRPSCALCDEVHEHPDGLTIEMLERGFKWRRQPLLLMITNSGSDRKSVCWIEHERAVQVAAGTKIPDAGTWAFVGEPIGDTEFSFVCGLDTDDDPLEDPTCWVKANPLLGTTITAEKLAEEVAQAKAIPGKANGILRLYFCQWTDSDKAWMARATLESCLAEFDPAEHTDKEIYGGLDLSASQDLTVAAWVARTGEIEVEREEGTVMLPTFDAWIDAFTPKDTIAARSLRDGAPYDEWAAKGFLTPIPGKSIRLDFVASRLAARSAEYTIKAIAYDRYSYRKLEQEISDIGLTLNFIEHPQGGKRRAKPPEDLIEAAKMAGEEPPQGLWMPGSLIELETLIFERRIRMLKNPVLIFAAMSAATNHDDFNNRWFQKDKAVNRIDAIVALAMAVGVATANVESGGGLSVFEALALASGTTKEALSPDEEAQILANPRHPRWEEARARYEERLEAADSED
jgi:phage terminase large subunit-like protein